MLQSAKSVAGILVLECGGYEYALSHMITGPPPCHLESEREVATTVAWFHDPGTAKNKVMKKEESGDRGAWVKRRGREWYLALGFRRATEERQPRDCRDGLGLDSVEIRSGTESLPVGCTGDPPSPFSSPSCFLSLFGS